MPATDTIPRDLAPPDKRAAARAVASNVPHREWVSADTILRAVDAVDGITTDLESKTMAFPGAEPIPIAVVLRHLRRAGAIITREGATEFLILRHSA